MSNPLARVVCEVEPAATVAVHDLGDRWVTPQPVDRRSKLSGEAKVGIDRG